jgi:hypothetical protein
MQEPARDATGTGARSAGNPQEGRIIVTGRTLKAHKSKITHGTPRESKLPCGCVVPDDECHVVENELLNITIVQCKKCKRIIALNPIEFSHYGKES